MRSTTLDIEDGQSIPAFPAKLKADVAEAALATNLLGPSRLNVAQVGRGVRT